MLLGSNLHIYTDHKNLTYCTLNSFRVLRWHLFLKEYGATYHYIKGKENVLADAFSRLPSLCSTAEGKTLAIDIDSLYFSFAEDEQLLDCFLNLPSAGQMNNPLQMEWIQ